MQIDMDRFRETFFEESAEHLANMESALLQLEHAPGDQELLNNIFRSAHSIKGASGTFGLEDVARFTHALENLLDRMRAGALEPSPARLDLLLRSSDVLRGLLASARNGQRPPPEVECVLAELKTQLGQDASPAAAAAQPAALPIATTEQEYGIVFVPDKDLLRQGMDPLLLLRDLSQAGEIVEVAVDLSRLPPLCELDPESSYLGWTVRLRTTQPPEQIREVFMFVQDESHVAIESRPVEQAGPAEPPPSPLRVPLAMAAGLIQLATGLVYAEARLARAANDFAARRDMTGLSEHV